MTIIRWRTQPQWERMIDFALQNQKHTTTSEPSNYGRMPRTNIRKTSGNYQIEMALPGVSKELIRIKAEKDILTISFVPKPQANEADQDSQETYLMREFSPEPFSRSFRLPENCDVENISARHENGILVMSVPFEDPEKHKLFRTIEVN